MTTLGYFGSFGLRSNSPTWRTLDNAPVYKLSGSDPVEVAAIATGFVMIRRDALEKFAAAHPDWIYFDPRVQPPVLIRQFFHTEFDPETREHLSEDYWFCKRCREIGIKIFLCPWIRLGPTKARIFFRRHK